jgi:hypothetical protein
VPGLQAFTGGAQSVSISTGLRSPTRTHTRLCSTRAAWPCQHRRCGWKPSRRWIRVWLLYRRCARGLRVASLRRSVRTVCLQRHARWRMACVLVVLGCFRHGVLVFSAKHLLTTSNASNSTARWFGEQHTRIGNAEFRYRRQSLVHEISVRKGPAVAHSFTKEGQSTVAFSHPNFL